MDPRDRPVTELERIEEMLENIDPDPLGNHVNTSGPLDPERNVCDDRNPCYED